MNLTTLFRYLFRLDTQAILEIAGCRPALWLGMVFVFSAGFAREYDGEDLLHEPWYLLVPLGASLATSFLLYCIVWLVNRGWGYAPFFPTYRSFLTLYWMTAQLAWLYAVPVERWMSSGGAVRANLWFLAIVAAWRVVLMFRVVSVLFCVSIRRAVSPILFFADSLLLVLLTVTPFPVIQIMGGVRQTEAEAVLAATTGLVRLFAVLSWPLWALGTLSVAALRPKRAEPPRVECDPNVSRSAWTLAAVSLAVWIFVLPFTQGEQQLRREVERHLRHGRTREALEAMSLHQRSDFPPFWDPPPRVGYLEQKPPLLDIVEVVFATDVSPWVREMFVQKYLDYIDRGDYQSEGFWRSLDTAEFDRHLDVLEQLDPKTPQLAQQGHIFKVLWRKGDFSETQRERIHRLLERIAPELAVDNERQAE